MSTFADLRTLLEETARREPRAPAVVSPGRPALSWSGLAEQVAAVGGALAGHGIGSGERVATWFECGPEAVSAFLGVAAHATCAPLDPALGPDETRHVLAGLGARALLVPAGQGAAARAAATAHGIPILAASLEDGPAGRFSIATPAEGAPRPSGLDDPCLVLHSSGTTDRPRPVVWEQAPLLTAARSLAEWLELGPSDRSLVLMPPFHRTGLLASILAPLLAGGSVACPPRFLAARFFEWLEELEPTWYTAAPAFHQAIVGRAARHGAVLGRHRLRFVRSSASPLPPALLAELERAFRVPVIEAYSMTEIAAPIASNPLPPRPRKAGSVGVPLVAIEIRGDDGRPCPPGVAGEVLVRGDVLRPSRASADLAALPDGWLRTGDQGYLDADGYLFLTGRLKELIDKGGEKVSPLEVDEALREHPAVGAAAAFALSEPRLGEDVAAAVVLRSGCSASELELQEHVAERLAFFKVPRRIVFVDAIPLGPTGKPDRTALARAGLDAPRPAATDAPEPQPERVAAIARLFAASLAVPQVGVRDDFFALGGDSLQAGALLSRVASELQLEASLPAFLQDPTPSGLARAVVPTAATGPRVLDADGAGRFEPFPLTEVQEAYWVGRGAGFELGNVACRGYYEVDARDLDLGRLESAFRRLVERHDMLRAVVDPDGRQRVLETAPEWRIPVTDLSAADPAAVEAGLRAIRDELVLEVKPSDRWPLYEVRATRLPGDRLRLHFSFEALVFDAWSRRLVLLEWKKLYAAPDAALPPLGLTFRDYVLAERRLRGSQDERRSEAYWRARLDTLPAGPELPLARDPASVGPPRFATVERRLAAAEWEALRARARRAGLTPAGVLLAAFAETLRAWSRSPRFTINLTLFNRQPLHSDVNAVVGDFTSLTMLEVDPRAGTTFEARARTLQTQLWRDLDHRHFGGVRVLRERARRLGPGAPAMPVVFTSQLGLDPEGAPSDAWGWLGRVVDTVLQTPQVWLDLGAAEEGGELVLTWSFVPALFADGLMPDVFAAYVSLLERLSGSADAWRASWRESARALLPTEQVARRGTYNETRGPVAERRLEALFEDAARRTPDAVALATPGRRFSYAEIEARSASLAGTLAARGAAPESLVAVVMDKGWEMLVATLGILRAGAAYLPIDPALPKERFDLLLLDGKVRLAATQPRWALELAWAPGVERVVVDEVPGRAGAPPAPTDAGALAYVIYTSGSSGQPKGVAIEHRAAVNTLLDVNRRFRVGPGDVVFALSALGFDLSVYDFFGTLAAGARVALPEPAASRDPSRWARFVVEEGVTVWNSVPAIAHLYAEYVEAHPELRPRTLRLFLLSGDWIPVDLPDRLRALAPGAEVVSLGGATEASVWSIQFPIERVDPAWESIPYGRPMANQTFHVLDEELAPRPEHVAGGLFIGGVGLARGYWGDAEKSAARFLRHPESGERLYDTGDRGRFLPSGVIEFLGRDDLQVKVQGHRIELLEVEAALARHPELSAAAAGSIGPRSLRRLVAWIVPATGAGPDDEALRAYLAARLPEAMVPSAFVRLARLPLTANGKVDRGALPEPHVRAAPAPPSSDGPADRIAALAARILPVPGLSADSNLLDLGATSVDLIRLANLLEGELGRRPSIDVLYRAPVVREIARLYADATPRLDSPAPGARALLLADPDAREAWKRRRPGLRAVEGTAARHPLARVEGLAPPRPGAERRSRRLFSLRPVPFASLSALLGRLTEELRDGEPRRQYASAGGLYAVQAYVWAKPGRLEALDGGTYYLDPAERALVALQAGAEIGRDLYGTFVNRPIFDEAAFALFLVADMAAIEPLYGERSFHYATLEAGAICQLLETTGAAWDVGLCQIGQMDFDPVRGLFRLADRHVLVHSLLGGRVEAGVREPSGEPVAGRTSLAEEEARRRARLREQVRGLSPAEVKALLEAERRRGGRG